MATTSVPVETAEAVNPLIQETATDTLYAVSCVLQYVFEDRGSEHEDWSDEIRQDMRTGEVYLMRVLRATIDYAAEQAAQDRGARAAIGAEQGLPS